MKQTDIRVGDWFDFNGKPRKISYINGEHVSVIGEEHFVAITDITPICLSIEILKKNKFYLWKHYKDKNNIGYEFFEYSHPSFDNLILRCFPAENNNTFYMYDNNEEPIKVNFVYVHQLQHLLWGLQLDDIEI